MKIPRRQFLRSATLFGAMGLVSHTPQTNQQQGPTTVFLPLLRTAPVHFMWLTDVHLGRDGAYDKGQPDDTFAHIKTLDPVFVIDTGDVSESGAETEIQQYVDLMERLPVPRYILPGNHDEPKSYEDPGPTDYRYYDQYIGSHRWAFSANGYRFIGFTSNLIRLPDPLAGFANVQEIDLEFVRDELANVGDETPILFTHFPLLDAFGNNIRQAAQSELLDLCKQHNVRGFLAGHRHMDCPSIVHNGTTHVVGGALSYNIGNPIGGFMSCEMSANQIKLDYRRGRSPWPSLAPTTTPAYTPIVIQK